MSNFERDGTSSALLEQLVYIDNFMTNTSEGTPNLDVDGQLSLDLAAFADDSFIFPDADKPKRDKDDFDHFEVNNNSNNNDNNNGNHNNSNNNGILNSGINANNINNANGHNNDLGLGLGGDNSGNNLHSDLTNLINKTSPVEFNAQFQQQQQQQYQKLTLNISELPKVPVPPGAQSSLVAAGLSQNQIDLLAALVAQHQQSDPKSQQSSPSVAATPMATTNSAVRQHNQITNLQELHQIRFEEESQSASPANSSTSSGSTRVKIEESPIGSSTNSFSSFNSSHRRSISYENDGNGSELDKRRRNTAASARFRIKKKQKEREMEQTISSLSDATKDLEVKIQQLEMENKLLRNLIVEKGSKRSDDELKELKQRVQLQGDDVKFHEF